MDHKRSEHHHPTPSAIWRQNNVLILLLLVQCIVDLFASWWSVGHNDEKLNAGGFTVFICGWGHFSLFFFLLFISICVVLTKFIKNSIRIDYKRDKQLEYTLTLLYTHTSFIACKFRSLFRDTDRRNATKLGPLLTLH